MIVKRALGADQQADDHNVPMFTDADGLNPGTIQNDVATAAGGSYLILGLCVGAIVGGTVLLVGVLILVVKKCGPKQKTLMDYDYDDGGTMTSKSEPSTRPSSPKQLKRSSLSSSCVPVTNKRSAMLMRSITVDMIPDFELPPERVQPRPQEEKGPQTALQFQHSLLSSMSMDMGSLTRQDAIDVDDDPADPDNPDGIPSSSGRLWFSVVYDAAVEELSVNLIKAKQLKPRDKGSTPRDPFVKLYLLPDEKTCQESRVRKKTLSPKFNETFVFKVACDEIPTRTLRMSVYDVDKRRVRHSLGHMLVALGDIDLTRGDVMYRDLEQLYQNAGSLGEMNISLCYAPANEKLKVVILRARNLRKLEYDTDTAVYVRVQLTHGQKVHKTKRTDPLRGTCEPVYNESITFTVPPRQIDACSVVATVIVTSAGRLGIHEEVYGKLTVGPFMYARGEELMHWQEMMAQPRNTITRWHQLTYSQKQGHV